MDPCEMLAEAIIMRAVMDWRTATAYLRRGKQIERLRRALYRKEECEKFFLSEWFTALSDLDGRNLLERLKKEG